MAASLPPLPGSLKPIQHYLKTAIEHDQRDPVVSYYCRFYAAQRAMELDRASRESKVFLMKLMDLLEQNKAAIKGHESMQSEVVAEAHIESYALKLFLYADNEDRAGNFNKNVVKSFYTAGMLMDVLTYFGELSEDLEKNRKYAKWKAAYIHNCLKNGETPHPGPLDEEGASGGDEEGAAGYPQPSTSSHQRPAASHSVPPQHPQPHQQPYTQPHSQPPAQPNSHTLPSPQGPKAPASTPVDPSAGTSAASWQPPPKPGGVQLEPKDYQQAMKFCKYASSALQYEDSKTAIENLSKALKLLTTGHM